MGGNGLHQKVDSGKINNETYLIDINMLGIPKMTSVYVIKGKKLTLIDGGTSTQAQGLIKSLKNYGLFPLDYIIITHAHWDHCQAVPAIIKEHSGRN